MKVIVADKISERGVELLQQQAGWNVVLTSKETLVAEIADAEALIVRSATKVTAELLDKALRLRVVGRAGVGVDNIDLDEATKRGVLVMSTPGGNAVSVAEHTFALLLALARQVPRLDKAFHEGRWDGDFIEPTADAMRGGDMRAHRLDMGRDDNLEFR
jgi:D-3-phosphoglycerate dehydrogenase